MKMRTTVCVVAIVACLAWATSPSVAATMVFLMGGQSNMDGYGVCSQLTSPYNSPQTAVKYWNNNGWDDLQGGFGGTSAYFGPEVSFGYQIHAMFPTDDIYLVKYAVDGTYLADAYHQWTPNGSGVVYNAFKSTVEAALQNLRTAGLSPSISGMAWMQGECDALDPSVSPAYAENLKNLIKKVRSDFTTENMRFVLGRITPHFDSTPAGGNAIVRTAQESVAGSVRNVAWFNTDDLLGFDNSGHYGTQGQIELGNRFAAEFAQTPEPGTLVLLAIGLLSALAYSRWR